MKKLVGKIFGKLRLMIGFGLSLFASCVSLFSCTPEPLDLHDMKDLIPEIVVSSEILPDKSVAVLLTKTVSGVKFDADKDGQIPIEQISVDDAVVTITTDGKAYPLTHSSKGMYKALNIPFVIGHACTLNVDSKSLGKVSAVTVVQAPVRFNNVNAKIYFNGFNDYWAEVNYALKDPPTPNYYMVTVQGTSTLKGFETLLNNNNYTRLVDDKSFNGQEFSEIFRAMNRNFWEGDSISVALTNVSEEYYNYIKLRVENNMNLVEVFSEPVHYPTNVTGGRGFFNLHYPDSRLMVLYF